MGHADWKDSAELKTRVTAIGEDYLTTHLAESLNAHASESVVATAIPLRHNGRAVRAVLRRLLTDDVVVRVGFPPPVFSVFSYKEYDEERYAHVAGLKEAAKRLLFKSRAGRGLRQAFLRLRAFLRRDGYWRRRLIIDWAQRCTRWLRPNRQDVLYWIGSDVLRLVERHRAGGLSRRVVTRVLKHANATVAPHLTAELREVGIPSLVLPFPKPLPPAEAGVPPFPQEFTVLTYVTERRFEFYGGPSIMEAARRLPDARFVVFGGTQPAGLDEPPPNVRFLGFIDDTLTAYANACVFVRLTQHDGSPSSVAEALSLGRRVIYSWEHPYCTHIAYGDTEGLVRELERLLELHRQGALQPDSAAAAWARAEYDPVTCAQRLAEGLRGLTAR